MNSRKLTHSILEQEAFESSSHPELEEIKLDIPKQKYYLHRELMEENDYKPKDKPD